LTGSTSALVYRDLRALDADAELLLLLLLLLLLSLVLLLGHGHPSRQSRQAIPSAE
jgi:hypothetical protein